MSAYKYVACQCGWRDDVAEDDDAGTMLEAHIPDCPQASPALLVPMWSIAWPYYWAVQDGTIPTDHFGLEMAWRPVGSQTTNPRAYSTGMDAKEWHLFVAPSVCLLEKEAR